MGCRRLLFSGHALRRMFERGISMADVQSAIMQAEITIRGDRPAPLAIRKSSSRPIPVVAPPAIRMRAIACLARPVHECVVFSVRELLARAALLDTPLPKMVAGEVRVAEASSR